jgi:hypothetical protein
MHALDICMAFDEPTMGENANSGTRRLGVPDYLTNKFVAGFAYWLNAIPLKPATPIAADVATIFKSP